MDGLDKYIKRQIAIVVGVITNGQGQVFCTKRNDPGTDEHNKWEFPGGKIEVGEDPEAAVIRELKEETNFDIKIIRLLPKIFSNTFPPNANHPLSELQVLLLCYQCEIVGGEFKPQDAEIQEGKFLGIEDIKPEEFLAYCKEIAELTRQ